MLVLLRKPDESIIIDSPAGVITVTVLSIEHNQVRLGIAAPAHIPIQRVERRDGQPADSQPPAARSEEPAP